VRWSELEDLLIADERVTSAAVTCTGAPVQMDGTPADGRFWYFRSRRSHASLGVGDQSVCRSRTCELVSRVLTGSACAASELSAAPWSVLRSAHHRGTHADRSQIRKQRRGSLTPVDAPVGICRRGSTVGTYR
jgi:hypothetical protein